MHLCLQGIRKDYVLHWKECTQVHKYLLTYINQSSENLRRVFILCSPRTSLSLPIYLVLSLKQMSQCRNTQIHKMTDEQVIPFLNQIGCHIFPFRTVLLRFNKIVSYFSVSRVSRQRFSQKTNKQICFVCHEKQKSKQNKFIRSFFRSICFRFYLTFSKSAYPYYEVCMQLKKLIINMNRLLPSNFSSRCTFHIEYICQICTLKRYVVRTWAYLV